jgi:mannose-6-phosphate isomerase-like protein (cupin superfamily)
LQVEESMPSYRVVRSVTRIPVPGGKVIEELVGRVNTGTDLVSVAHMVAPQSWGEPPQTPDFAEITIMVRGRMRIEAGGDVVEIGPGEAFHAEPGLRVRYSNPFGEESEYYAICVPAFTVERAVREGTEGPR